MRLNFDLTAEQQMIRKMIKEFADDVVAPGAIDRDRTKDFPVDIFKQLSEMGMMGLPFPEKYGGGRGRYSQFRNRDRRIEPCLRFDRDYVLCTHFTWGSTASFVWNGRAETTVFNADLYRGIIRRIRIDGTECRIGCGGRRRQLK